MVEAYKDYVRVLSQSGAKLTGADITFNNGTKEDIFKDISYIKCWKYTSLKQALFLIQKIQLSWY